MTSALLQLSADRSRPADYGAGLPALSLILLGVYVCLLSGAGFASGKEIELRPRIGAPAQQRVGELPESFVVDAEVDPADVVGGNVQVVTSIVLGTHARGRAAGAIAFELREGNGRGSWEVWVNGELRTGRHPRPEPAGWVRQVEYQLPHIFQQREGRYAVRIAGAPQDDGWLLRFYFEHHDRPVTELVVTNQLAGSSVWVASMLGGKHDVSVSSRVGIEVDAVTTESVRANPSAKDVVLDALDLDRPELAAVSTALRAGDRERAAAALLRHLRTRTGPPGPALDRYLGMPQVLEVAREACNGRYATLGWWANFVSEYTDAKGGVHPWILPDGGINWARDNGHLNRHFHWVALAVAWQKTGDAEFLKRFSFEVKDWVSREPFYWDRCPQVGGLNLMDGTTFELGYMNTSNIGRRCEMTWWQAYDVVRRSPDFDDEAHMAMLLGFLRQMRLLMNPTSFAAHDDGGAHGAMALLQTALMMPEFRESARWKAEALRRWDEVLKVQFYPDGSHVSGSTGYNWASLMAIENFVALMRRVGEPVPERFTEVLARALQHPIALSRPNQGQIDLNDGGWGMVDDHYRRVLTNIYPDRADFRWMATKGAEGAPPDYTSIYFPHAGHVVMRTGWGEREKFLFMDAGPMGASHGKNDKLSIYLCLGPHELLSSGGRGSYDANPYSAYTGSTYAYNTVIVDDRPQQRVHLKHTHTGHVPEKRRWISNEHFDFAEGVYRSGWYGAKTHVQGTHRREILFVKGPQPPATSYWIVIDTVAANDDEEHEFKALFHSRRDAAEFDPETKAFVCLDRAAGFRVLPGRAEGLTARNVRQQTEPYIQGWHVYGTLRAGMNTAEYAWRAKGESTRVWILESRLAAGNWRVKHWAREDTASGLRLTIRHADGQSDQLTRRATPRGSELQFRSLARDGSEVARLQVPVADDLSASN